MRTGLVVAQASALAREENLDSTPSRYYKDSPVLIKDKVVEGYAKTATTPVGQRADAVLHGTDRRGERDQRGDDALQRREYQDALGQYRTALSTPQGEQLRAQSGIYLTSMKLGRTAEAEAGVRPASSPSASPTTSSA